MNIIDSFKNIFNKKSRIKLLEEEVQNMKDRIFKKKVRNFASIYSEMTSSWLFGSQNNEIGPKPLEEDFFDNLEELENKIDLITKYLKIEIKKKPSESEKLIVKKIKK